MKYYIIAGEASGDLHGGNLIKEIKKIDASADVRCWGGEQMKAAGGILAKHYKDLAFMGFAEVIKNLGTILQNIKFCKQDVAYFNPDVLVLIDYPGFNLRIAKWAKKKGFKIIYYISPQVWAWKESRVRLIKRVVDKMLVILPFEKKFYEKWDYKVEYIGHPLVQVVGEYLKHSLGVLKREKPVIALLPGSRKQEISVKLPVMLQASESFSNHEFIVAKAASIEDDFYNAILKNYSNVSSIRNETYKLLSSARAALVTSGTATLETALFGVPQVVCYKGSFISFQIAKRLVKIKYISLVNLIMDKPVVKELIQNEFTVGNVEKELDNILHDSNRISAMKNDYAELKNLLQQDGNASQKAAEIITNLVKITS